MGTLSLIIIGSGIIYRRYKQSLRRKLFNLLIDFFLGSDILSWTNCLSMPSRNLSTASVKGRTIHIPYIYRGNEYEIYVPFSRSLKLKMINEKIYVADETGKELEMKLQPGVQCFVNASMLRADNIKTLNLETNEMKRFSGEDFPDFS